MKDNGIRVGIITDDTNFKTELAASFTRYSPKIDIIMEKRLRSFETIEEMVNKIKSSGINVLFLSSSFANLGEALLRIKSEPLIHVRIFLLMEKGIGGMEENLLYLSDYNVLPESDMLLVNTRVCALCDNEFLNRRQRDKRILLEIAERNLLDNGFGNITAGAYYLKHALVLCAYNAEFLDMMSALYFAVQHEVEAPSEKTVEKCIRTVINGAYKKYIEGRIAPVTAESDQRLSRRLFGEGKPTAAKAITMLSEKIVEDFAREVAEERKENENYRT
jgi:hypothetical protein